MTRTNDPNSNRADLDEDLVAYLDGELDAETTRDIEDLLATDPTVRDKLHRLEHAWDALGELPRAELDEAFTHSTIEMVAISAAEEMEQEQKELPRRRRRRLLLGVGSVLAALGLGFLGVSAFWPNPNQQLLSDLPLLEQLDTYSQVEDIEFLRNLAEQELWSDEPEESYVEPTTIQDRQLLLEQMSPEAKESLLRKQQRFLDMSVVEQDRLRDLHKEVQQAENSAELRKTLANYYEWLSKLSATQIGSLASLDPEARLARIAEMRLKQLNDLERYRTYRADMDAVANWFAEQVRSRLEQDDPEFLNELEGLPPVEQRGVLMLYADKETRTWLHGTVPDNVEPLLERLSPSGKARFDNEDDEGRKRVLLSGRDASLIDQAIRYSIRRYFESLTADITPEEMMQSFQALGQKEKDELLRMPSEWRDFRLRMMHLRTHKSEKLPQLAREFRPETHWWMLRGSGSGSFGWSSGMRGGMRDGGPPGSGMRSPGGGRSGSSNASSREGPSRGGNQNDR